MAFYYVSSGFVSSGIVYSGQMNISSGGTAIDVVVLAGSLGISGRAKASQVVLSGGSMTVAADGIAKAVTVNPGAYLAVGNGGTATRVVENGGHVRYDENHAKVTFLPNTFSGTISKDATLHSGTTATDVVVTGGKMTVFDGGVFDGGVISNAQLEVCRGGIINNVTYNGYIMYLSSGAIANGLNAISGTIYVSGGAVINNLELTPDVSFSIGSGAVLNDISLTTGGGSGNRIGIGNGVVMNRLTLGPNTSAGVGNGGTLNSVMVDHQEKLTISSGAVVTALVENGGSIEIQEGASVTFVKNTISGLELSSRESATIHSQTTGSGIFVGQGGNLIVFSDGTIYDTVLSGCMATISGGTAYNTTIESSYCAIEIVNGTLNGVVVNGSGFNARGTGTVVNDCTMNSASAAFWDGSIANHLELNGGTVQVYSGCTFNDVSVNKGYLWVIGYDRVNNVSIASGGTMSLGVSCTVSGAYVSPFGKLYMSSDSLLTDIVYSGGSDTSRVANGTVSSVQVLGEQRLYLTGQAYDVSLQGGDEANEKGRIIVSSNGYIERVSVWNNGQLELQNECMARNVILNSGGNLIVSSGAVASDVKVNSRGGITISSGGTVVDLDWTPFVGSARFMRDANWSLVSQLSGVYYGSENELFSHAETMESKTVSGSGGSMFVMEGGAARDIETCESGRIYVWDGGNVNGAVVSSGAEIELFSGGHVENITVSSGGSLNVYSGCLAENVDLQRGNIYIASGGTASNVLFNEAYCSIDGHVNSMTVSRCNVTVHSGGSVDGAITFNHGCLSVGSGAAASNVTINSFCSLTVFSGGFADGITVSSGGCLVVSMGAKVNGITWTPGEGAVQLEAGAVYSFDESFSGVYYGSDNRLLSRAQTLEGVTVGSRAAICIASGGTANGVTITSGGSLVVYSGGSASNVDWTPCMGEVRIEAGGQVSFASELSGVYYGSSNTLISSAAVLESLTVGSACSMYVMSGGEANDMTVSYGGYLAVNSGGTANSTHLRFSGTMDVFSGGTADDTMIETYSTCLAVSSGGVANRTQLLQSGALFTIVEGGIANETSNYRGSMHIYSGGTANSTVNLGAVTVYDQGMLNGAEITSWGSVWISSGGTAKGVSLDSYSIVSVCSGGVLDGLEMKGGYFHVASGGTALNVTENGGYLELDDGAEATFVPHIMSGFSGSRGRAAFHAGATVVDAIFRSEFECYIYSGAVMSRATVDFTGSAFIMSGGTADSNVVNSSGFIYVSSGGMASNTLVHGHGVIAVSNGGTASATELRGGIMNVYSGGSVHDVTMSAATLYLSKGGLAEDISFQGYGSVFVFSGASAIGASVTNYGTVYVSSGGYARDITLLNGSLKVSSGAVVSDVTISSGGQIQMENGASATGIRLVSGISLSVQENNTFIRPVVDEASLLYISGGASAVDILENGGCVVVQDGASATFLANAFSGTVLESGRSVTVHSGTTANETVVNANGHLQIFSGGTALDLQVNSSGLVSMEDACISRATIGSGGSASIGDGASVCGMTVETGGNLVVQNGTGFSGLTVESGAFVNGFKFNSLQSMGSGIVFSSIVVSNGESAWIGEGQTCADIAVKSGGILTVHDGANLGRITVSSGGSFLYGDGVGVAGADILFLSGAMVDQIKIVEEMSADSLKTMVIANGVVSGFVSGIVSSGQSFSEIRVRPSGDLTIRSGGVITNVVASASARINIESGASVNGAVVLSGALLQFVDASSLENVTIHSGARINGFTVRDDGIYSSMDEFVMTGLVTFDQNGVLHPGQTASGAQVGSHAKLLIDGGAHTVETEVGGEMDLENGAHAANTTVLSGGLVQVKNNGTADAITIQPGGSLIVSSGGSASVSFNPWQGDVSLSTDAEVTWLERDANVYYGGAETGLMEKGSAIDHINITSGNSLIVYADGVANEVYVNDHATMMVLSGGTAVTLYTPWNESASIIAEDGASVTMLDRDANIYCGNGAKGVSLKADTLQDYVVTSGNTAVIFEDGTASNLSVCSGAHLVVHNGGTAETVYVSEEGGLIASSGAVVTVAYNPWSGAVLAEEGAEVTFLERDATLYYGGSASGFMEKGDAFDRFTVTSGNTLIVYEGGFAGHTFVNDSGTVEVLSGGNAEIAFNPWHGEMIVAEGGTITHLEREYNVYYGCNESGLISSSDEMDGLTVASGNSALVYSGGVIRDMRTESCAFVSVFSGGLVEGASLTGNNNQSLMTVEEGGVVSSASVFDGVGLDVYGMAYDVTLSDGFGMNPSMLRMYGEGYADTVSIYESGAVELRNSSFARNIAVHREGSASALDSSTVSGATIYTNGGMVVSGNASIFDVDVISGGSLHLYNDVIVHRTELEKGAKFNGFTLRENNSVHKEIIVSALEVDSYDAAYLYQNQFGHDIVVDIDGTLNVLRGGYAENIRVDAGGAVEFAIDGTVEDITFQSGAQLNKFTLTHDSTYYDTLDSFTVSDTVVYNNSKWYRTGATLYFGQTAIDTLVTSMAALNISSGGKARKTRLFGDMTVSSGGYAEETTVDSRGYLVVGSGARIDGVVMLTGGTMTIQNGVQFFDHVVVKSGGTLCYSYLKNAPDTGLLMESGSILAGSLEIAANISLEDGVNTDPLNGLAMDFTGRTTQDRAMIDNMSPLKNKNINLWFRSTQEYGEYAIGANAWDYAGTITVRTQGAGTASPTICGQLSLEQPSLSYEINEYTLSLNETGELCLTVESSIPDGAVFLLYNQGRLVSSVESAYEIELPSNEYNHLYVLSGGTAEGTQINGLGKMTVLSGGTAIATRNKYGVMVVASGGVARDVTATAGSVTVVGGTVEYVGGDQMTLTVTDNGVVYDVSGFGARTTVAAGGSVISGSISSGFVSSGGLLTKVDIINADIYESGVVSDNRVTGILRISSGGTACNNILSGSAFVKGGLMENTIVYDGTIHLSSGGTAVKTDIIVYSGRDKVYTAGKRAQFHISDGGLALDTRILSGTMNVVSGGIVSRTSVNSIGVLAVSNGGQAVETTMEQGGNLFISGSGSARDVLAQSNGAVHVSRFGQVENITLDSHNMMVVMSDGHAVDATVRSGGYVYLRSGAILDGRIRIEEGAVVSAYAGAIVDFDISKANSSVPLINDLSLIAGAPEFTITVSDDTPEGTYLLAEGVGTFDGSIAVQDTLLRYGKFTAGQSFACGWYTYLLNLENDRLILTITRNQKEAPSEKELIYRETTYDVSVHAGERIYIPGRYSFYEAVVNRQGTLIVQDDGLSDRTQVNANGFLILQSGGSAYKTVLANAAKMEINSGASADVVQMGAATLNVSGGYAVNVFTKNVSGVGTVNITDGGFVSNLSGLHVKLAGNGTLYDGFVYNLSISSGGIMDGGTVRGSATVYDSGILRNTVISGAMTVRSGGLVAANSMTGGSLLLSGGTAREMTIRNGNLSVGEGGLAEKTRMTSGQLLVLSSGLALDTVISRGVLTVRHDGIARRTEIDSLGRLIVSKNGLAESMTMSCGGRLLVSRGGVARDVHAEHTGAVVVSNLGLAEDVTLDLYNMMIVSRNGRVSDATINSGAEVYLHPNAVLGGQVRIEDGAFVMAYDQSIVSFDLAKANDAVPLFNDLGRITGNPDYVLTISDEIASGTYLLASGAEDFDRTITVRNHPFRYGTLSLGGSLSVGWNTFTLDLDDGLLSLTVTRNASESTAAPEVIVDKIVYDAVIHTSETFHITSGFSYCETTVEDRGYFIIPNGAAVSGTTVNTGGRITVQSGASATNTYLGREATMNVQSGAFARSVTMEQRAELNVNGGTVCNVSGGNLNISGNGYVSGYQGITTVLIQNGTLETHVSGNAVGHATLSSGGVMIGGSVFSAGNVFESGLMSGVTLYGTVDVFSGGVVRNGLMNNTVNLFGGIAEDNVVSYGSVFAVSGGTALRTNLKRGQIFATDGGVVAETFISGGTVNVSRGGAASGTIVLSSGSLSVKEGGTALGATLTRGGRVVVSHGGVVRDVHAMEDGAVVASRAGLVDEVTIEDRNMLVVSRYGSATNVNVKSGGEAYVYKDAVLGGKLRLEDGALVSAYEGSFIDFNLALANASVPLIDNLNAIIGLPTYSVTVSAETAEGVYLLATGATGFDDTITVQDDGVCYGDLSLADPLFCGWNTCVLNLVGEALTLTVTRNEVYQDPIVVEPEEEEVEELIVGDDVDIDPGDILVWEKTGEVLRVTSGVTLSDTEIPWGGTLILEKDAILQGAIRFGTDVLLDGIVDATEADVELDISKRKEEYGVQIDHLIYLEALSYSVLVSPDQNKGEYILAGNADRFSQTITVRNTAGVVCGTLSLWNNILDYDVTRYTLCLNENNELVFVVSSAIDAANANDRILLYKNDRLVLTRESIRNELIAKNKTKYDQMIVVDKGVAEQIRVGDGGLVTVQAGGMLTVSDQTWNGWLRFDYAAGDSTVIKGLNTYGAFSVYDNRIENVQADVVTVSGNVLIRNYHGGGTLTTRDGVTMTETAHGGNYVFRNTWIHDFEMLNATICTFQEDTVVQDSEWNNVSRGLYVYDQVFFDRAVFGSTVFLFGGTLSETIFNNTVVLEDYAYIHVEGDLYFNSEVKYGLEGHPLFDMHGHTAVFDCTHGYKTQIQAYHFSEDTIFQVKLKKKHHIGTYSIGDVGVCHFSVDGEIIGTVDKNHRTFEYGLYSYVMDGGSMFVDIADDSDGTYNFVWYDIDDNMYHAADVYGITIGSSDCAEMIVRNGNGELHQAKLSASGSLEVRTGGQVLGLDQQEGGFLQVGYSEGDSTVITGVNPYGSFFVKDNVMENFYGTSVSVSGKVAMHDYHGVSIGHLSTGGGVSITGSIGGGDFSFGETTIKDYVIEAENTREIFFGYGTWLDRGRLEGGRIVKFLDGSTISNTVILTGVTFAGTIYAADIEINRAYRLESRVVLDLFGDLTLNATGTFEWNSCINVNGHTVNVNYMNLSVGNKSMISLSNFSEDANFRLLFQKDQKIGTYTIANNAGSFVDFFLMNIGGMDTEELSFENPEMDYGNYHYALAHDVETQLITLTIDVSLYADETFNVYYWDSAGEEFYHSATVDGGTVSAYGSVYNNMTVRNHGIVRQCELNDNGLITVWAGGHVTDLTHNSSGRLRFDYTYGDETEINGTNPYGSFFVENNVMENVYGENITVTGAVMMRNYHSIVNGRLYTDGTIITGTFDGGGTFFLSGSTISDFEARDGRFFFGQGTSIAQAAINASCTVEEGAGRIEDTVFNSSVELQGGTYSDVVVNSTWYIDGYVYLDGDLTLKASGGIYNQAGWKWNSLHAAIDGRGNTLNLDLTGCTPISSPLLNLDRVYNTELRVVIDQLQPIGTYSLGANAFNLGQGDAMGVYNWDTNKWDFQGAVLGDMDGVISVYDVNGIELANCTVNGDTEYYGRYNYTAYVDADDGRLKLKVGWNTRDDQVIYAADDLEANNTMDTATVIDGNGTGIVPNLTIHSDSDDDWFQFTLDSFGRKSSYIGIDFKQWAGDLDFNLYNSNGQLIDYARSVTDNERLSLTGFTAGTYYLKVYGYGGNKNSYRLVYDLPVPIALTDDYETGDDKAHSYFLKRLDEQITINASISRSDDQDYYMFILPDKGLVSDVITLTYDDEFGDLDLYLYDQNGKVLLLSSTNAVGGQDRITLAGLKHGVYYAAVRSKDGSVGNYQLVFDVNNRDVSPDKYEDNNSLKKATKLYTLNGEKTLKGLSIHSDTDVDYYRFSILEKGSADDFITLTSVASLGDLDIEILNVDGEVVAYSRTAENEDTVSLKGLDIGEYYIRVYGYNNVANNYSLSWHVTNSSLIPADEYEGHEPIPIREDQTISGLSIAKVLKEDETREDTFKIMLEYDAWKRSKIILTDYRSDWEDGMKYVIRDADGNVLMEGVDSEISLYGLTAGEHYLTLDAPNEDEYSEYSLIAQCLPDSDIAKDNTWSLFIYMAGDNNLEESYLHELLYMQKAILPENVEVYVLLDRHPDYAVGERNWTDTRVGKIRHSSGGAIAVQWMYFDGPDTDTYMNTHNLELKQEWDTGKVTTLEAFLDWGMKVGRADNYALIIKDHGSSLGYNCKDETSGSIMSISDIADLLKEDKYEDLSVVAFDQCLMGSDVVVTTMEGTVDYVVASEAVGYTPNLLVMYKVLLNSLETEMTPREVSQKIVAACNCSGFVELTMASFQSADHNLSEALNQFGELSKQFTFADWVALCNCYSKVHNYGDDICAYSDLGSILNMVKGYHDTISSTLLDAANALYDTVINVVIDSTMITPDIYGTGLAVFNPIYSSPLMANYTYGGGSVLNYYATDIGQAAWGEYQYKLSRLADECASYIADKSGNLTFTDFNYYYEDGEIKVSYELGAFSGDGVTYEGLYMDHAAYFDFTLKQAGVDGDAIVITADNPNAKLKIYLMQPNGIGGMEVRRISENGTLPLDGINVDDLQLPDDNYSLIVTSTEETTYTMKFVADWSNGVDYFDYRRTGSISPLAAGNNSIDKATQLSHGNYGGLVTCAGDQDYFKVLSVYANNVDVTVTGAGLSVREFNADGELLQTAAEENGRYKLTVAKDNYVCVEGTADISTGEYNSYMLSINDAAQTYLKAVLDGALPGKPVVSGELTDNTVVITVEVEPELNACYSTDLNTWRDYDGPIVAENNGRYYFKAVEAETSLESNYVSYLVDVIDLEPPTLSRIVASATDPTNQDVVVRAEFTDNVAVDKTFYRIGEEGEWLVYEDGVTLAENATVYFKALDLVGNESEIASCEVANIDKVKPVITLSGDNQTPVQSATLMATVDDGSPILYQIGNSEWMPYSKAITVTANATYCFKATDAAGNICTAEYVFANIDTVPPVITLSGDNQTPSKKTTLTATVDDGSKMFFSTDQENWTEYTEAITVTENATYFFTATDAAGNEGTNSFTFANIDTVAPVITLTGDNQTSLQKTTLTATVDDGSVIIYSTNEVTWQDYTAPITVTANVTYYFKATDAAGNKGTNSFTFANIDTVAPVITLTGDNQTPLQKATLTAAVDDGSAIVYSTDEATWLDYTGPITVTANATYYFKSTDAAGNEGTHSITFANIDTVAPVITLTGDNQTPSQSATLTAAVDDGSEIRYSLDQEVWLKYTGPITVSANATYYFRATDAAGNTATAEIAFANIDTTAPVITLSGDNQSPLRSSALTAEVNEESAVYYSTDEVVWTKYEGEIAVTENVTYYFTATDAAGNVGKNSFTFANIDTTAPVITLSGDNQSPLRVSSLTAAVDDGSDIYYSTDQATWTKYEGEIAVTANATYYFTATDAAGNIGTAEYVFANIDTVAPVAPVASADVTTPTNTDVYVSAEFSDDSVKTEFSLNGTNWKAYTGPIRFAENGTVSFRGMDAAGNVSDITTYEVTNIDKVALEKPIATADILFPTNTDVRVSAIFPEDAVSREYSRDNLTWKPYTAAIVLTENGTVYFRNIDGAGNVSEVTKYEVANIDKVAPEAPVVVADVTEFTNGSVTVTATFSEDSVKKEYTLDGGETWQDYDAGGVIIIINGTIGFCGIDAAGNVSVVTTYEVANIDKVAPEAPTGLVAEVKDQTVTLSWSASTDNLSGVKGYVVTYSHDGQEFSANTTATSFVIENAEAATWNWTVKAVDAVDNVSEVAAGEAFTVEQAVGPEPPTPAKYVAKFDVDGNGISDVMFVWSGNNYQHGYWMNGSSEWQSAGSDHPAEWENLGCYDMTGDGKADSVLVGNVVVNDVKGAYIGYYADANDLPDGSTWVNIGYLNNADDIDWKNKVGNLTGGKANSIVWYAPELYALGAWTDGTDSWTTISNSFGGDDWTLVGCGDFDGDGKDSVVMSGANGTYFYTADIDGAVTSMGAANWSGWEVRAIGDFKGDGKDDMVLFHKEYGSMVMLADGNLDSFESIGQLDAKDWFVVGAGDYNGDQHDDLLVRQYSTGMLGYYTSGDTSQWVEMGRGVDMQWTVIA